jgi:sugar (pentulose or hexulose) kinase
MDKAVAVIDIGMTNKKVAVYDASLRMLDSCSRTFEPVMVEGLETHDLGGMEDWFLDRLSAFAAKYPIGAIAVATHGATTVCVGADGLPSAPCVYYTHEPGEAFQSRFYALAGSPESLQAVTGTPRLSALINPAKGVFFLSERFPERFARTEFLLNYPQYWGFRLTGRAGAEGTYIGCHSYLWDWERERYSSVARILGVADKMPQKVEESWSALGRIRPELAARTGLSADTLVTMGIHDSNASLLPHLAKLEGKDFVLNSTGTWCVLMHPQEKFGFSSDELGKVVFFNRSAFNKPVKTAIFLGGMEYETWSALVSAARPGAGSPGSAAPQEPGPEDYRAVLEAGSEFILPEVVPGSGQFPGSKPRAVEDGIEYPLGGIQAGAGGPAFLKDGKRAIAVLNISLAIQTLVALERTGLAPGAQVFTEGGFRKNGDYNAVLAAALPGNSVYLTDIAEATALGAAMTALAALDREAGGKRGVEGIAALFKVEYIPVAPMAGLSGFAAYMQQWLARVGH